MMPDENVPSNDPTLADITPVSVDDTPIAPAGVSMLDRPKELRAEDYGRDKPNVIQDDGSLGFFDNIRYSLFTTRKKIMNILLGGILSTVLGALKLFLPTLIADAGIPAEDQAAAVTLADNIIAYVQKPEPAAQEFLDDCDSLVTILTNIKAKANPDISKAFAAIIGALNGLKAEFQPK